MAYYLSKSFDLPLLRFEYVGVIQSLRLFGSALLPVPLPVPLSVPMSLPLSVPLPVPLSVSLPVPLSVPLPVPMSLPQSVPLSLPLSVPLSVPFPFLCSSPFPFLCPFPCPFLYPFVCPFRCPFPCPFRCPFICPFPSLPLSVPLPVLQSLPLSLPLPVPLFVLLSVPPLPGYASPLPSTPLEHLRVFSCDNLLTRDQWRPGSQNSKPRLFFSSFFYKVSRNVNWPSYCGWRLRSLGRCPYPPVEGLGKLL